jgi:GNAT superfamily N-acetyltransferase
MDLIIERVTREVLPQYSQIQASYRVESVFAVRLIRGGLGGIQLWENRVEPYTKDYDASGEGGPERWPEQFDVETWGIFLARCEGNTVGGVTVAHNTGGVSLLEGREDLAVLWDLRVVQDVRRLGIGTRLIEHSAEWARAQGCSQLIFETQNVNVPACRLYERLGCELGRIDRYGYRGHPIVGDEVMLVWYLKL